MYWNAHERHSFGWRKKNDLAKVTFVQECSIGLKYTNVVEILAYGCYKKRFVDANTNIHRKIPQKRMTKCVESPSLIVYYATLAMVKE